MPSTSSCVRSSRAMAFASVIVICLLPQVVSADVAENELAVDFFEQKILPVLETRCYQCHSSKADDVEGGLLLDSRESVRDGGDSGPAVIPHDAAGSLLLEAIRHESFEMPPDGKLNDEVIADFERWIRMGAPDPRDNVTAVSWVEPDHAEARKFWAFQPIEKIAPPDVPETSWSHGPIDSFVHARLRAKGLAPAPVAERIDLVRRLYFDLLGLPPAPGQIESFLTDASPDALERQVDRLLASPHYGERWGQHWLDVVRFAETEGFEYDRMLPGAWRFRDYVIDSLNADKPYDRFLTEQIAGDEMDPDDHVLRVAAGLQRLGPVRRNAGNQEVASSRNEVLIERTDIIGSAFLGLTVGCARCHDHKFDPIPQRDYYRLQAYFAATREHNVVLASGEEQSKWKRTTKRIEVQIARLKRKLRKLTGPAEQQALQQMKELEAKLPPPLPTICSITNVPEELTPIHVLHRGNWDKPRQRVGLRPLGVLVSHKLTELAPELSKPRTELARWLTEANHPLTARVMVNRIWQNRFGQGLVGTANDFGNNGARPTHPGLLDHLARTLLEYRWRFKPLHRQMLLSNTFRQSSRSPLADQAQVVDPENKLLWHFRPRRLSAEEVRDAMLAVSGQLNRKAGGRSVMLPVDQELIDQLYKPSQWQVTPDPSEHARRSVYLVAKRNLKLPFMEVFDQPPSQTSCALRQQSTHAPQALELLNGRISNQLAEDFARRLRRDVGMDPNRQVDRAYRLATGRAPTDEELELAVDFLRDQSLREFALATFNLNAFLYVH